MKRVLLFFAIACASVSAFGQTSAPSASPLHHRTRFATLTPDERAILVTTSKKATQDPAVKAAHDNLDKAMKAARDLMAARDPSLVPIFDKVAAAGSPGAKRLTAQERTKLRSARDAIKETPEGEAWQQAGADYRQALHKAMIAADPAVAPILAKLPQPRPEPAASSPAPSAPQ